MNIQLRLFGLTLATLVSAPMNSMDISNYIFNGGGVEAKLKIPNGTGALLIPTEHLKEIMKQRIAKRLTGDALTAPEGQYTHPCILSDYISSNSLDVLRQLLERGVNPNGTHPNDFPLHTAVAQNNFEACKILVEFKADVNRVEHNKTPLHKVTEGRTLRSIKNNVAITQLLLLHQANPNIQDDYGLTPLMNLAETSELFSLPEPLAMEMAELLIKAGANLWIKSYDNLGPGSIKYNNKNVLELATKRGKNALWEHIIKIGKLMGDPTLKNFRLENIE